MKLNYKISLFISVFGMMMILGGVFLEIKLNGKAQNEESLVISYASKLSSKEQALPNKTLVEQEEVDKEIEEDTNENMIEDSSLDTSHVAASLATSIEVDPIVYDNMTMTQLAEKLNRSLNSTLAGKGELFATRSIELGVDPYLALAIVLHETGCKWNCSQLVKECNNVGGQKGGPTCGNGSYKAFATLDDGINGFLENLYNNYYAYGLTTPELMNPKYAASTTWAMKVNSYIEEIKAK